MTKRIKRLSVCKEVVRDLTPKEWPWVRGGALRVHYAADELFQGDLKQGFNVVPGISHESGCYQLCTTEF